MGLNDNNIEAGRPSLRDWLDPTRIYNTFVPAERWPFVWGLLGYPLLVMFVFLTMIIIVVESVSPQADVGNTIGIIVWFFMLAWVTATVCICYRRLRMLRMSPAWVWLMILPIVNLGFFIYLVLKSPPNQA